MWRGDALQIGFHNLDRNPSGFWREYLLGLTGRGADLYSWAYQKTSGGQGWKLVGEGPVPEAKAAARREGPTTCYEMTIPQTHLGSTVLRTGEHLQASVTVFNGRPEAEAWGMKWADGIAFGDKNPDLYGRVDLVADARDVIPSAVASGSLIPNFSFEQDDLKPWTGNGVLDETTSSSGTRSLKLSVDDPQKQASMSIGDLKVIQPDTSYRLRLSAKQALKGGALRLRFYVKNSEGHASVMRVMDLKENHDWRPWEAEFSSGPDDHTIWLCVETLGAERGEAWVDDVVLEKTTLAAGPLKENRVFLLTDHPTSSFASSLKTLNPRALRIFRLGDAPSALAEMAAFKGAVVATSRESALSPAERDALLNYAKAGHVVFMDLQDWARLRGLPVRLKEIPNRKLAPEIPQDKMNQLSAAIQKVYGKKVIEPSDLPEEWMRQAFVGFAAEQAAPVLKIRVVAEDKATTGFPVGSLVPWAGSNNGHWQQRGVAKAALPPQTTVLAETEEGDAAVLVKQQEGQGVLYAADMASLNEPFWNWATRCSSYKYIFLGNLLNDSIRYGRHWNKRPRYAEFMQELRSLARKYPALKFTLLGYEATGKDACYPIYGFVLGDWSKPTYLYTAMLHAEDEWTTMFGAYSLAEWFGQHANDPEVQKRLRDYSVTIIPIAWPSLYHASLGTPPGTEPIPDDSALPPSKPPIFYAYQMHLGGGGLWIGLSLIPGVNDEWNKRIGERAAADYRDRYLYWTAEEGPKQAASTPPTANMPESWYGYFNNPSMYQNVFPVAEVKKAKNFALSETTRHGYWPDSFAANYFTRAAFWEWFPHDYALCSDLMASFAIAAFLTDPPNPMPAVNLPAALK